MPVPVPVTEKVTVPPEEVRLFPLASFKVTVSVLVAPLPATMVLDVPETVLLLVEGAPGVTVRLIGLAKLVPFSLGVMATKPAVFPAVKVAVYVPSWLSTMVPMVPVPVGRLSKVMVPPEVVRLLPLASFSRTVKVLVEPLPATMDEAVAVTTLADTEGAPTARLIADVLARGWPPR